MAIETIAILDASGVSRTVKADSIGTDFAQVMKMGFGADGVLTLVEAAAPLPVQQTHGKTIGSGVINTATSGDNTLVAAVAGKAVRVIGIQVVCNAAVVVTFKDSTPANLTGPMSFSAQGGFNDRSHDPNIGVFKPTATGAGLVMNLSGAVQVSGYYIYVQE